MSDNYVKGVDALNSKLRAMQKGMPTDVEKTLRTCAEIVRGSAVRLVPVNHGELRQSIHTTVKKKGKSTLGICYTNKEYAAYVEFGTGPVGKANHDGISPKIHPKYSLTGWGIPASAIDPADAARYHMTPIKVNGEVVYYLTKGQPAQPFLYPALKNNEERIVRRLKSELGASVRDKAKGKK